MRTKFLTAHVPEVLTTMQSQLTEIVQVMLAAGAETLLIHGQTCYLGTPEPSNVPAQRRAESVIATQTIYGLPIQLVQTIGCTRRKAHRA